MVEQIRDRLRRVEERLDEFGDDLHSVKEQSARIEVAVSRVADDVTGLLREVGGVSAGDPTHRSIRARLHDIESSENAARAATAALEAARAMRRDGWSRWQKVLVTAFAAVGAAGTLVSTVYLIASGGPS